MPAMTLPQAMVLVLQSWEANARKIVDYETRNEVSPYDCELRQEFDFGQLADALKHIAGEIG
jgi:hypothetical protein